LSIQRTGKEILTKKIVNEESGRRQTWRRRNSIYRDFKEAGM